MHPPILKWFFATLVAMASLVSLANAQDKNDVAPSNGRRVALVIGNAEYKGMPLRNPVNDAKDVAAKLKTLGFEVIIRTNITSKQIGGALREFKSKLSPGSVALFFYAGHGVQIKGENYLPAVDAEIGGEEDVPNQSLSTRQIMNVLEDSKTRLNLVFLDACRDNPFARSFRSSGGGLAKLEAPSGTLISFATRPGSVAADGEGNNGLYTENLLKVMAMPNVPIEQALKQVVSNVKRSSNGKQEPWMEGSIEGDFYFLPSNDSGRVANTKGAPAAGIQDADFALWSEVKSSGSRDYLEAYLSQYPKGKYVVLAKIELKRLVEVDKEREKQNSTAVATQKIAQQELEKQETLWRKVIGLSASVTPVSEYFNQYPGKLENLKKSAMNGDAVAQGDLSRIYTNGLGALKDQHQGFEWAKKSAMQGNAMGQNSMGVAYERGVVVPQDMKEAVKWYRLAADQGSPLSQSNLGWVYYNGKGMAKNDAEAVKWFRLSAEKGHAGGQDGLAHAYTYGRGVPKNENEGMRLIKLAADQGHSNAIANMGWMYYEGKGFLKDEVEAVRLFRRAALDDSSNAQNGLGAAYRRGRGVQADEAEAAKWYKLASDQGNSSAQNNLAYMYRDGKGVTKDLDEAMKLFRKSADQGNSDAQVSLGYAYRVGLGVAVDFTQAIKWFKLAADQDNAQGINNIGHMHREGFGVNQDFVEAEKWFRKSALLGNSDGQNNLGSAYQRGQGLSKDESEAVKWYRLAADQGNAFAQLNLGLMLLDGRGVSKDEPDAVRWLQKSADQGLSGGQNALGYALVTGRGIAKDKAKAMEMFEKAAAQGNTAAKQNIEKYKNASI